MVALVFQFDKTGSISKLYVWFVILEKWVARFLAISFGFFSGSNWVMFQSSFGLSFILFRMEYQTAPLPIDFNLSVSLLKKVSFLMESVFYCFIQ